MRSPGRTSAPHRQHCIGIPSTYLALEVLACLSVRVSACLRLMRNRLVLKTGKTGPARDVLGIRPVWLRVPSRGLATAPQYSIRNSGFRRPIRAIVAYRRANPSKIATTGQSVQGIRSHFWGAACSSDQRAGICPANGVKKWALRPSAHKPCQMIFSRPCSSVFRCSYLRSVTGLGWRVRYVVIHRIGAQYRIVLLRTTLPPICCIQHNCALLL